MSQVSYSAGTRFLSMIGGTILSFYDWYADMPIASPQVFGDQTDVPESGDWWNSGYLIIWGTNLPITRTPDAHFMTEARYRGQKVVVVSPDYSDHTKFADDWLACGPGHRRRAGDGDGSRDPHRVLPRPARCRTSPTTSRPTPTCRSWSPCASAATRYVPDRFLTAADLGADAGGRGAPDRAAGRGDRAAGRPERLARLRASPTSGEGRWNLDLGGVDPLLTLYGRHGEAVPVDLPRFDVGDDRGRRA